MPSSTKYSGNPFISRRERQESVVIYNKKSEEVNKEAFYISRTLKGVKTEINLADSFTTSGHENQSTCRLYVELRDGNPGYVNYHVWIESDPRQWTAQPGLDYFVANGKKFMIESIIEKTNINGGIDILEIVGNG